MTVILVIHILVSIVLVCVVLLQRSEGGALGVGGGGGGGGLMSGRGAAGALVRTTIIFGAIFFVTSLVLTTIASRESADSRTAIERELDGENSGTNNGAPLDVLNDFESPLLDTGPADPLSSDQPETTPDVTVPETSGPDDPLATDVQPEESDEEPVEDPQQ